MQGIIGMLPTMIIFMLINFFIICQSFRTRNILKKVIECKEFTKYSKISCKTDNLFDVNIEPEKMFDFVLTYPIIYSVGSTLISILIIGPLLFYYKYFLNNLMIEAGLNNDPISNIF